MPPEDGSGERVQRRSRPDDSHLTVGSALNQLLSSADDSGMDTARPPMQAAAPLNAAAPLALAESSEELVQVLTDHAPIGVFVANAEGEWVYVNARACTLTGLTPKQSLGSGWQTALHPDDAERVAAGWAEAAGAGENFEMEYRFLRADGSVAWCEASTSALRDRRGTLIGWVGACIDVTEHRLSEERYRELFENARDAVFTADAEGNFLAVNRAGEQMTGFAREELLTMNFFDLVAPDDAGKAQDALARAFAEDGAIVELKVAAKDGRTVHVEVAWHVARENGQPVRIEGIARDTTEHFRLQEQLRHQAFHDPLTGLPNRSLFLDRLSQALTRAEQPGLGVAVMLLDLDNFKLVNDSLGHHVGDQLLGAIAARLLTTMRGSDTVARLGGDEFGFVIESFQGYHELVAVAERIVSAFGEPFATESGAQQVAGSIGIALGRRGDSPAVVLRNADTAMYSAKATRRGSFELFDPTMRRRVLRELDVKNALTDALRNDHLDIHYQPIVSLANGDVLSVEALARWLHPQWGWVSPTEFIPLAEADGLIVPLGRKVLAATIRQVARWYDQGPERLPLGASVNVSPRQLADPDFIDFLTGTLHEHALPPEKLGIEVTERVFIDEEDESVINTLNALARRGVQLSLDDFGTGYSALASLKRFPFTALKIDRYFTRAIRKPSSSAPITTAIVALGRTLGLTVIAEGVENEVQANYLRRLGCHAAQGFYYARPQSAGALSAYLDECEAPERREATG